jgi:hypothetical protein
MKGISAKVIAACFTLAAFTVAVIAGLASDNPAAHVLVRAVVAMLICYPVGFVVGMTCERVINAHIESHEQANPAPVAMQGAADAHAADGAEAEEVITV